MDNYSYQMVLRGNIDKYLLNGFKWTITSIDDLVVTDGKVTGIKVVDKLIDKLYYGNSKATALIGEIKIDVACTCDEYSLYATYVSTYPNLTISFNDEVVTVARAPQATFYTNAYDSETNTVHYTVKGDKQKTIGWLISAEGPTKVAMIEPNKPSTNEYTYTFSGSWTNETGELYSSIDSIVLTEDMSFYPVYNSEKKVYTIEYYNYDNSKIITQEYYWYDTYNIINDYII